MEFETKVKVDTTRQEKVFTASQIGDALYEATIKARDFIIKVKPDGVSNPMADPIMSIILLSVSLIIKDEFEKALGINGPDGAYIDKK